MSAAPASGLHSQGRCLTSIISILEREHEGGFGHSSPSRNTATVPPDALCGRGRARGEVATPNSLQLHHDCAFRDSWSGHTSFAGILGDPLSCCPSALVGTSLVLVDRDREPSASGAHEGIAHETLYPPDETFHFSFVLLQEVEKRLRAFARIVSDDSMHDTPPTADILHVSRRRHVNDNRSLRALRACREQVQLIAEFFQKNGYSTLAWSFRRYLRDQPDSGSRASSPLHATATFKRRPP